MKQDLATSVRTPLAELVTREYDILVIGGGITGAGILRDAAMRGLSAVLVERGDFGTGTSSRSSRLVHGGLRYLEQFKFGLVREALRERETLLRIAPHLVHPLPFLLPSHRGDRVPRWKLAAGMALYGLLAAGGNVPRPRTLGKAGVLALEPNLRSRGLRGGSGYTDAQCDDARLVIATIRSALIHGAHAANYLEVVDLDRTGSRITGVTVVDRINGGKGSIRARIVVNATGPWTDALRRLEDPAADPILRPTKGVHVVVPRSRMGHRHGITLTSPIDGRVLFVLPWGEYSYIGTTDTDFTGDPAAVEADPEDIRYLLRSANSMFPHAHLGPEDVVATWAALRPLVATDPSVATGAVSREHLILTGAHGMLTIAGGKLTTYRQMAEETVDAAAAALFPKGSRPGHSDSATEPLPGGESDTWDPFLRAGLELGLPAASVEHLLWHYGTEAAAVMNLLRTDRRLGTPIQAGHPALKAEVIHAVRRELAQRVDDVLARRIHLSTETTDHGVLGAPVVASLMARELGWSPAREAEETVRFTDAYGRSAEDGADH